MKVYFVSDQNKVGRTVNRIQMKKQHHKYTKMFKLWF